MRKIRSKNNKKREAGVMGAWQAQREKWKNEPTALALDLAILLIGFVLGRGHLAFGAYPLGLAFIAVLPSHVAVATLGCFLGALSMGKSGVIFALISAVTFMLRLVLSSAEGKAHLFTESLLTRISCAVIGGFLAGVYQMLLSGLTVASAATALTMILAPGVLCFLFSGLFAPGISLNALLFGNKTLLRATGGEQGQRKVFFQISFLVFSFILVLALREYRIFGLSVAALPAAWLTLLAAKRFGPLRGMAVGFFSSLALSGTVAVALAIAGLASGLLFPFGLTYALGASTVAVGVWSAYAEGLSGFLSAFPEFLISALLASPILKRIGCAVPPDKVEKSERLAAEMVGSMALSKRASAEGSLDALQSAVSALSPMMHKLAENGGRPSQKEYETLCIDCSDTYCKTCAGYALCLSQSHRPFASGAALLAEKLYRGDPIGDSALSGALGFCRRKDEILDAIRHSAARLTEEKYRAEKTDVMAQTCAYLSRMLSEARAAERREHEMNEPLSEALERIFAEGGFPGGVIRAFGKDGGCILAAGEDKDGTKITAPALKTALERAVGAPLATPQYFRKEDMVLMECHPDRRFEVESATAALSGAEAEISGDVTKCFTSKNRFIAALSDGMGMGKMAQSTAAFTVDFLEQISTTGCSHATALSLLNHILRGREEECSATVDLFEFDLIRGEGQFLKSGAAPSFIKRGTSLFRIRSETAPIGLLSAVDSERIKVEVKCDDIILLLSDGICQSPEDAPWLMELLGKTPPRRLSEYAEQILSAAVKHHGRSDDMTVLALRILPA
ncbi:MAG: SpoIIE family protein phosphatase [Clostridia bacterium]|nr:SpoIIE family protein phosphatase [Clostridia bacterium]